MGKGGLIVFCCILFFTCVIILSGCASTSYVNRRFQELEDKNAENTSEIERLSRKMLSVDSKAEEALQKSSEALTASEETVKGPSRTEQLEMTGEMKLNFEFDSYELNHIANNVLDEIGKKMQQNPNLILEIMGHTDAVGSEKYNLLLGHNRAESAMRYLKEKYAIPLYRMYIVSYGESQQVAENDSPKGRAANRRVILRLFGPKGT